MKCWKCQYTHKIERKYGVTTHCNLEPTEMDVTFHVNRKRNNILCPFINEHTRYSSINYDKYIDENVEEWINEYRDQVDKETIMDNYEFGKPITQICRCCGKVIKSTMWNYGGSLEYIIHDNFAFNIKTIFGRHPNGTIEDYGEEFIELTYDTSNKPQPNHLEEFIECFMHYNADEQLKKDIVDYVRANYR